MAALTLRGCVRGLARAFCTIPGVQTYHKPMVIRGGEIAHSYFDELICLEDTSLTKCSVHKLYAQGAAILEKCEVLMYAQFTGADSLLSQSIATLVEAIGYHQLTLHNSNIHMVISKGPVVGINSVISTIHCKEASLTDCYTDEAYVVDSAYFDRVTIDRACVGNLITLVNSVVHNALTVDNPGQRLQIEASKVHQLIVTSKDKQPVVVQMSKSSSVGSISFVGCNGELDMEKGCYVGNIENR